MDSPGLKSGGKAGKTGRQKPELPGSCLEVIKKSAEKNKIKKIQILVLQELFLEEFYLQG